MGSVYILIGCHCHMVKQQTHFWLRLEEGPVDTVRKTYTDPNFPHLPHRKDHLPDKPKPRVSHPAKAMLGWPQDFC